MPPDPAVRVRASGDAGDVACDRGAVDWLREGHGPIARADHDGLVDGIGTDELVVGDRGVVVLDAHAERHVLEHVVVDDVVVRVVEGVAGQVLRIAAFHRQGVLGHARADPHAVVLVDEHVVLDDVAVGAVATVEPALRALGHELAAVLVEEDAAGDVALERVVADDVEPRPVDRQALASSTPEPEVDAREREHAPRGTVLAEAVADYGAVLDDAVLRAGLEVDARASGPLDVEVAERHALDIAVDEDPDAARVHARAVFDRDVREAVLVLDALGELAEALALDVEVVEEALDVAVAHGDV